MFWLVSSRVFIVCLLLFETQACLLCCSESHVSTRLVLLSRIVQHVTESKCCHQRVKITTQDSTKVKKRGKVHFLGLDGSLWRTRTKTMHLPTYVMMLLPQRVYVTGLFWIFLINVNGNIAIAAYCPNKVRLYCACKHGQRQRWATSHVTDITIIRVIWI